MRLFTISVTLLLSAGAFASNIDPYDEQQQFVWSENVGWIDMEAAGHGALVTRDNLTGYLWSGSIGWINLFPKSEDPGVGIRNDGKGNLSGLAWSENAGWINFAPRVPGSRADYGVKIGPDGTFSGWAWGENIGWINFNTIQFKDFGARVCVVTLDDLARFADQWLRSGYYYAADLDHNKQVDLADFDRFVQTWQTFCPDGWTLK